MSYKEPEILRDKRKGGTEKEGRTVPDIVILFLSKFVDFFSEKFWCGFNEMCSNVLVKADVLRRAGAMNNGYNNVTTRYHDKFRIK